MPSSIDTLILLDREIDLITPLTTPLTYEGLIDELIGIDYGKVSVDASVIADIADPPRLPNFPGMDQPIIPPQPPTPAYQPGDKVTLILNNCDPIYYDIRDISIEKLGMYMQDKAIQIRKTYNKFRENKDASLQEIADFVKKIPAITREYRLLHTHINVAELVKRTTDSREFRDYWHTERGIMDGDYSSSASGTNVSLDFIEDIISADIDRLDYFHVLRLLCLQSLCSGGIRKNYDQLKKLIIQTYGYEHIFTLYNLERAGFLKRKETKSNVSLGILDSNINSTWQTLKKSFNLIPNALSNFDDQVTYGTQGNIDIGYVAAGYAPLSVRLIQAAANPGGWGGGVSSSSGVSSQKSSNNTTPSIKDLMKLLPGPLLEFCQYNHIYDNDVSDAVSR